jgi:hypothetical protein
MEYEEAPFDTYVDVLSRVEVLECFEGGLPNDPTLFRQACIEAAIAVPFDRVPPKGAFARHAYAVERLADACEYRNRWYRNHLPAPSSSLN